MSKNDPIFDPDAPAPESAVAPDPEVVSRVPQQEPAPTAQSAQSYRMVRVPNGVQKSTGVTYVFLFFALLGIAGLNHFYLRHYFRGVFWLFTWGLMGIGLIYDLFATPAQVYAFNVRRTDVVAQPL